MLLVKIFTVPTEFLRKFTVLINVMRKVQVVNNYQSCLLRKTKNLIHNQKEFT